MKIYKFIFIFLIALIVSSCFGQNNDLIKSRVENLKKVNSMPYIPELSGDSLFWVVVKEKMAAIPFLIEKLSDTTELPVTVPNFGGNYTVADIANVAIQHIIKDLPVLEFVTIYDNEKGYFNYWTFVRANYENRKLYQEKVRNWYSINKSKLVWHEDNRDYRTSIDWKFEGNKHPAGGYYKIE